MGKRQPNRCFRRWILTMGVTLMVGFGSFLTSSASAQTTRIEVQSVFQGSLIQLGEPARRVIETINTLSQGRLELVFNEPGALVPALVTFDAVSSGAIGAGWGSPGFWAGKEPALQLFSSVPFGPGAGEYLAWMDFGGGRELMNEVYYLERDAS